MRLYHCGKGHRFRNFKAKALLLCLVLLAVFFTALAACTSPQATQALINFTLTADGQTTALQLPAGSTVQQALDSAHLSLNALDRTEPPVYTVLGEGTEIRLIRVTEEFEVEQVVIPFEQKILRNESLPKDKEILIQKGKNGQKEITYRRVLEDGVAVFSQPIPVKSVIVEQPIPEILMIGIQAPFSPVAIPGQLLYLRDGNVWIIEGATGNRRAILTTGDLDGRVFSLSSDGAWLLFTRGVEGDPEKINSLWVANISGSAREGAAEANAEQMLVELGVFNIIHFADWFPGSNTKILFSTVEPRAAAPGWQANNDLISLTFSPTGWTTKWATLLEANSGGVYGWWGTTFLWGPDGQSLAYTRPDSIGMVDLQNAAMNPSLEIKPLLTRGDWAWVPGLTWGPDGKVLYTLDHVSPAGAVSPEESPLFDLTAVPLEGAPVLHLVSQTGMFSYPLASPLQTQPSGETGYQIAFLQATFPNQSDTSRYRLAVMDRDGSNRRVLFPSEDAAGLEPLRDWGAWSPALMPESGNYSIAVLYLGNLWIVNSSSGEAVQITGDGLTSRVIWVEIPTGQGGE